MQLILPVITTINYNVFERIDFNNENEVSGDVTLVALRGIDDYRN